MNLKGGITRHLHLKSYVAFLWRVQAGQGQGDGPPQGAEKERWRILADI